jgi:uncharacterized membrane protein
MDMERMLAIVFDDETKAYEGSRALSRLDSEGSISIYAEAVVKKNADGTLETKQSSGDFPIRPIAGSAIGALIGVLGGPIGIGVGAVGGAIVGGASGARQARVDEDFVKEVSAKLTPGKWAVVSDISEEWVTPVDTTMESLGGAVFRTARKDVEQEHHSREVAALRADIAQLKAEKAKSGAEQKAKLQAKIDRLDEKLHAKLAQAKERSDLEEKETQAKLQSLRQKATRARGETKAALEARMADIRNEANKVRAHIREGSEKVRGNIKKESTKVSKRLRRSKGDR